MISSQYYCTQFIPFGNLFTPVFKLLLNTFETDNKLNRDKNLYEPDHDNNMNTQKDNYKLGNTAKITETV